MTNSKLTERVRESLRSVIDPELGLSIVDLGLVRDILVSERHIQVLMTLTTPACPYGPELIEKTEREASAIAGAHNKEAVVQLVWEPPWDPMKEASKDALAELGVWL